MPATRLGNAIALCVAPALLPVTVIAAPIITTTASANRSGVSCSPSSGLATSATITGAV